MNVKLTVDKLLLCSFTNFQSWLYYCECDYYRQHCAQRKAPVFRLLRGDFEVFRPAGATRCTDWGEIWRGSRPKVDSSTPNLTPIGAEVGAWGPQN